jgi:uncharacterized protein (DUF952 family)
MLCRSVLWQINQNADTGHYWLVMVDADLLGHRLKWEPARGGALFPHLYGQLDTAAAIWVKELPADEARASYLAKLPMD